MDTEAGLPERQELTSWKEVADYLGVTIRTAQIWEHERGLPVMRLPGRGRARILVPVSALEQWKRSAGNAHTVIKPVRRFALMWLAAAAVILAAAGFATWRIAAAGATTSFRIENGGLVALDNRGRELWRRSFERPLCPERYRDSVTLGRNVFWSGDLDGDGRRETLFIKHAADLNDSAVLICYSALGDERWRFRPGRAVATAKESFPDRFHPATFTVAPLGDGGSPAIVVVSNHVPYYPSQVALLSASGELLREYWHSGHLYVLAAQGSRVYLGGISNGHGAATMVVLDPEHFAGASAESDLRYQLVGLPAAAECARILFPRTCINRKFEPYGFFDSLALDRDSITAIVAARRPPGSASALFEFAPSLVLKDARFADSFRAYHADLRARGEIDHDLSDREEAELSKVSVLTPSCQRD